MVQFTKVNEKIDYEGVKNNGKREVLIRSQVSWN